MAQGLWRVTTCNGIRNPKLCFTPGIPCLLWSQEGGHHCLQLLWHNRGCFGDTIYAPSNELSTFHPFSHSCRAILAGSKSINVQGHNVLVTQKQTGCSQGHLMNWLINLTVSCLRISFSSDSIFFSKKAILFFFFFACVVSQLRHGGSLVGLSCPSA